MMLIDLLRDDWLPVRGEVGDCRPWVLDLVGDIFIFDGRASDLARLWRAMLVYKSICKIQE